MFRYYNSQDLSIEFVNSKTLKRYMVPEYTPMDSVISCHNPKYKDLLKEMDICLKEAFNEKSSVNLKNIVFRLVYCPDIAVQASNSLYKTGKALTHANIQEALQRTSLKEDFDLILKKYNLHVANENCYEEIYLVKKTDFLKNSNYPDKKEVPDSVLDADVCLNIAHIK